MSVLFSKESIKDYSSWILTAGILVMILGVVSIIFAGGSTLASMGVLGVLLIVRGGIEVGLSARIGFHHGFGSHLFLGILSLVVGAFILWDPVGNAVVLTLLIGLFFFINGLSRLIASLITRGHLWGRIAFGGLVSVVLGAVIFLSWPVSSVWTIGTLVGCDLLAFGALLVSVAQSNNQTESKTNQPNLQWRNP